MQDKILNILKNKLGDYASAEKISRILGVSKPSVYTVAEKENIRFRKNYGRKEYEIKSFFEVFEICPNIDYLSKQYTKEDFDLNNFLNWEPKCEIEKFLLNYLIDELTEFCTVKELVAMFKISKTTWYEYAECGKIISFSLEKRKIILTRSILPLLREGLSSKEN